MAYYDLNFFIRNLGSKYLMMDNLELVGRSNPKIPVRSTTSFLSYYPKVDESVFFLRLLSVKSIFLIF